MVRKMIRKKTRVPMLVALLLLLGIIVFVFKSFTSLQGQLLPEDVSRTGASLVSVKKAVSGSHNFIPPESLYSSNAILVCLTDRITLMQKKSEEKIYPASLTKMMTVIVAIENISDIQERIELSNDMFQGLYNANAATAGFQPGEEVKAIDLLYGALLPSGAECCIGLANEVAGSEEAFVELMNKKAGELALADTNFVNTTGLHDKNHYTTVKDMATLLGYALENETFREIFTTERHSTSATNKHPDGITFYSTMYKKLDARDILNGRILGGKTGYTGEAGLCLASLALKDGKEYILITVGAKGDHQSEQYNISDAMAVYNNLGKES